MQAKAFGFADLEARRAFRLDTICRVFCVTKTFAARPHSCTSGLKEKADRKCGCFTLIVLQVTVAFMMLVEDGLVRLEDPVAKFLPAFADVQVNPWFWKISSLRAECISICSKCLHGRMYTCVYAKNMTLHIYLQAHVFWFLNCMLWTWHELRDASRLHRKPSALHCWSLWRQEIL